MLEFVLQLLEMESQSFNQNQKFKNPQEEIDYLRNLIAEKESSLSFGNESLKQEEAKRQAIDEFKKTPAENILDKKYALPEESVEKIVLDLKPELHDETMEDLLGLLFTKGLKNALSVVEKLNSPHIDDDFHRLLVQYIKMPQGGRDLSSDKDLYKVLNMKLYEVVLPQKDKDDVQKSFRDLVSVMEQFYAGMISISDGKDNLPGRNYFSLEIAVANGSNDIVFYCSIPSNKGEILERHILALYPGVRIKEVKDDYNIFNETGASVASFGRFSQSPVFPIKNYEEFENDPMSVLLNVFSKLRKDGEGAALQINVLPAGDEFLRKYGAVLDKIKKGVSIKEAVKFNDELSDAFIHAAKDFFIGSTKETDKEKDSKVIDETAVKLISKKIESTIVNTNMRIITSAHSQDRAEEMLHNIESAFSQFAEARGNGIIFEKLSRKQMLKLFHEYSYRLFSFDCSLPMNFKELTTIFHFPELMESTQQLKQAKSKTAPAPIGLEADGILLGVNKNEGSESNVYFSDEDRMRHFYVIGQTGTGKTTILKNMIVQDIEKGHGVCMIDPHGTDINDILANIPKERIDDVIYFDPSDISRPMGLNMLEYDIEHPEQKIFVINELLSIFNKLFDMKVSGGPAFEQYFRNSAMLVMDHPESGNTILDISRVLSDKDYRDLKLSHCKNPLVVQFWQNALKTSGDQALANYVPYITNKFDVFLSNEIMRPVVTQEKSAFNFRQIMDEKKILLVNLSKGKLGDINSSLIGLILVGKILMAALSRVDVIGQKPADFFLYIDEFQNVTTDSISTILSEARKYRLSLNIAHQFIAQLQDDIKGAVFGNVGSMAVFRVGSDDAEYLKSQFDPVFSAKDIINLDNRNAYIKMLINGQPARPFSLATLAPKQGDYELAKKIKELSSLKYGKNREEVEGLVMEKYRSMTK